MTLTDKGRRHVALVVREMDPLSRREQAELGRLCRLVGRGARPGVGGKETGNGAVCDAVRLARAL